VPRKVDHEQRRANIVEALLRIAGTRGLDAVSLREVAQEAGVSMGAVQHYFATKDEMLLYALQHWLTLDVHQRFMSRIRQRLAARPTRDGAAGDTATAAADARAVLSAVVAEYLPHDERSRADAKVALAFISRAAEDPTVAEALRPAYTGFVEALRAIITGTGTSTDGTAVAERFAAFIEGLRLQVLTGAVSYDDALALARQQVVQLLS
jgi:TetR/AcrR family transcriptional regulator, transcriptional repressor of bet genes